MAQKPITYEDTLTGYIFWGGNGKEKPGNTSLNNIIKRDTELREAGWVPVQGAFSLSAPQRKIVKVEPYRETAMHLAHLMAFYAGNHEKANETPYTVYAYLSVWVNTGDEDDPYEIGIDTTFTRDPEGKNNIGVSMTTYIEGDDWGGLTMKEWLNLDGKTYPIGTPIWVDRGNRIEILIDPKQGK